MESDLIAWLRSRLPSHPSLRLGIGDDAAVLSLGRQGDVVVATDIITDGVDFDLRRDDPRRIGRKALGVNLSDLAAMAARPVAALVGLVLPEDGGLALGQLIIEGMLPLAEQFHVAIAGGDTNSWSGGLVVSITVLGETTPRGPLRRGGARPGDRILVTGEFGGSIQGRHFDFVPRVAEALALNKRYELHAGMDVSDGLSLDLARLAQESGCGAVLDMASIPISAAARQLSVVRDDGVTPLEHALTDGEDFELVLAVPPAEATRILADTSIGAPLTDIGEFVAEPGLFQSLATGERVPLMPRGWEHKLS